jgi:hypothetical protein
VEEVIDKCYFNNECHAMLVTQYSTYINTTLWIFILRVDDNSLTNLHLEHFQIISRLRLNISIN